VSRDIPVPQWPLSERGRERMRAGLSQRWIGEITSIYCSSERKAVNSAEILANHLSISYRQMAELGENDRSSTGFLEPPEFERVADEFFAKPSDSVRGWIAGTDRSDGSIAIVAHGAVGTLVYCWLAGLPISRRWDQPANGGGNFYRFTLEPPGVQSWWKPIDD
jgi:broad specificity phosphatase PhoE